MTQKLINNQNINQLGGGAEFQAIVQSMMSNVNTGELVEVVAVDASGLSPVGFVSVRPLVFKIDGDNSNVQRGVVHNVPYFRLQGGANAIIIDPVVGDKGFCGVCSRDTSLVKRLKSYAAPNSRRSSDISDAVYFGGMLNGTPSQYVMFKKDEIVIKATSKITLDAPSVEMTGKLTVSGIIESLSDVITKTISLFSHKHGNVQSGNSDTGIPK